MNREDIIRMAREFGIEIDIWEPLYEGDSTGFRVCEFTHEELERFTKAVYAAGAAAERVEWEKRVARLQSLMDLRESQPNKPCCLAEREAIVQMIENTPTLLEFATNDQGGCLVCGFTPKLAAAAIRARGNKT